MTEKQTIEGDWNTVKDQLEYFAKQGLNPYAFAQRLTYFLEKDEQLKTIFNKDSSLNNNLRRAIDLATFSTFESQDLISKQETFNHLKRRFKHNKDSFKHKARKDHINIHNKDQKTGWTIYSTSQEETRGEFKQKWQFVHFLFKYKVVYPGIWLVRKLFGKKLKMPILNTPYNENLMIFDTAYEDAIRDWNLLYLRGLPNPYTAGKSDEWWDAHIQGAGVNQNLRLVKDAFLAVGLTDTAYREFINLFVHRLAMHAGAHYKRVQEAGNGKVRHLFYSAGFAEDIHYYHMYKLLRDRTKSLLVETGRVTISDEAVKNLEIEEVK